MEDAADGEDDEDEATADAPSWMSRREHPHGGQG